MNHFYKRCVKFSLVGLLGVGFLSAQLDARSFIDGDLDIQKFSYEDSLLKKGDPNGVHKVQVRDYKGKMQEAEIHSEIRIAVKPGVKKKLKKARFIALKSMTACAMLLECSKPAIIPQALILKSSPSKAVKKRAK